MWHVRLSHQDSCRSESVCYPKYIGLGSVRLKTKSSLALVERMLLMTHIRAVDDVDNRAHARRRLGQGIEERHGSPTQDRLVPAGLLLCARYCQVWHFALLTLPVLCCLSTCICYVLAAMKTYQSGQAHS